ncbi:hypothetical protein AXF42_Ash009567 [Apostasia shenzhenica]|uniref:Uncharacterized protein n=1 Tax=Apostasia shenzhenica TaxID=1088818 RepID=A0A2I0B965_9ASPA|nr:hypothetical protein AXF42_Ash009567 [Apostasia shenzhenica]
MQTAAFLISPSFYIYSLSLSLSLSLSVKIFEYGSSTQLVGHRRWYSWEHYLLHGVPCPSVSILTS